MAITFRQLIGPGSGGPSPLSSPSFTPNAAGDTVIFVTVDFSNNVACTFSGSGGTYVTSGGSFPYTDPAFDETATGYCLSVAAGAQTATFTATAGDGIVAVGINYSGITSVGAPTVVSRSAPGTGANAITGTAVSVPSGSTLLAFCYEASTTAATITTSGTNRGNGTGDFDMPYCWAEYAGSGASVTPQFTTSAAGSSSFVVIQWVLTPTGGGTSFTLGGQSVASTEGVTTRALSNSVAGQAIASTEGVATRALSNSLAGQSVTSALGSISASVGGNVTVSLAGRAITSTQGAISSNVGYTLENLITLEGQLATFTQGTLAPATGVSLTGLSIGSAFGAITPQVSPTLVGLSISSAEGTILRAGDVAFTLGGLSAAFALGTITNGGHLPAGKHRKRYGVRDGDRLLIFDTRRQADAAKAAIAARRSTHRTKPLTRIKVPPHEVIDVPAVRTLAAVQHREPEVTRMLAAKDYTPLIALYRDMQRRKDLAAEESARAAAQEDEETAMHFLHDDYEQRRQYAAHIRALIPLLEHLKQ
jgi:hypothetical protein